jgi:AcrR family transcriptional regulator
VNEIHLSTVPSSPDKTRKRQPAEVRRRDILDAALELFVSDGYEASSVADIARGAGVATGTVYRHFPSKEHLLKAVHQEFHERLEQSAVQVGTQMLAEMEEGRRVETAEFAQRFMHALGRCVRDNRAHCVVICRYWPRLQDTESQSGDRRLIEIMAAMIEGGTRRGVAHASDPEMAARFIAHGIRQPLGQLVTDGTDDEVDRFLRQAAEIVAKSLQPLPHQ